MLERGLKEFSGHRPLLAFLAMTLYNLKEHKRAATLLLRLLTETTSDKEVSSYSRAIEAYAEDLDKTW